ncbi:MAG: DUF4179 domain-containing protein [Akkermansiaceae bacterium]
MSINTEYNLNAELIQLESQLIAMTPKAMPEGLLEQMTEFMNEETYLKCDIYELEQQLGTVAAATMPEDMLARMANAMDRWHEDLPVEDKLVSFASDKEEVLATSKKSNWRNFSAAAAVAILGSITAFVTPSFVSNQQSPSIVNASVLPLNTTTISAPRDAWLVPDSFSHQIIHTSENGVVMSEDNKPHRCIKIEYLDKVKVMDDRGHEIEIERPGVEMVLLPLKTD